MAKDNSQIVFYQQWVAAWQQVDKYSSQPWCVDSKNLDIFSDTQSVKAMAWTEKAEVSNEWIDIDPKGRFYLASDGRVWDSDNEEWIDHDYFDENANQINYSDWQWQSKAVFWTPKKLWVAYWSDWSWKTISILTDRLLYNIYSDWIHIQAWDVYWLRSWEPCTRDWIETGRYTVMSVSTAPSSLSYNGWHYENSEQQMDDCPWGFHTEPDRVEKFMRMKMRITAQGWWYKDITLESWKSIVWWNTTTKNFISSWTWAKVLDLSIVSLSSWSSYDTDEFFYDNFITKNDSWNWTSWIYIHATTDRNANQDIRCSFYKKEDWTYLYPKDRNIIEIEDDTYIEIDSTEYEQLSYYALEDKDWNTYYQLTQVNTLDLPDDTQIVAFARGFDFQYCFANKWDLWIVYYMTDVHLATWDAGWRFVWTHFINAIMIGNYTYVLAEKRWVRGLYIFSNWDMKKIIWAENRYTEWMNLVNGREFFNFNGLMANWRDCVVCPTKDEVYMYGRNKLGINSWAFILKVDWEITRVDAERWYLDVYYEQWGTEYRQTLQDDVNIRRYQSDFNVTYPLQISSHINEKEPLQLGVSYMLPNSSCALEAYLSVNDYYFWSFKTDWNTTPTAWDKFKMSWCSGDYWLVFVEKRWGWLTFTLSGNLPYQSANTKNLVSEDNNTTIAYTDFNHFKFIGDIKTTNKAEECDWKHIILSLSNRNNLPVVRKAQVKIIGKTDNHVSPELYDVRLLSDQFDR